MKLTEIASGAGLFALVIALVIAIGAYIANIVALVSSVGDPLTGMFILRVAGVFIAPLGVVLGFF